MSKTYSLRRRILFSAVLITLLGAAANTIQAQDISQLRNAITGGAGLFQFSFRGGSTTPETLLVIDTISDSGSFTGKYYSATGTAPSTDNVSGTINVISGGAIRIRFTVNAERISGVIGGTTTFDGALLFDLGVNHRSFMAGTYTIGRTTPIPGPRRAPGPYPFCANFAQIPG